MNAKSGILNKLGTMTDTAISSQFRLCDIANISNEHQEIRFPLGVLNGDKTDFSLNIEIPFKYLGF
jgi:hypothetical protein